jgi:hypothetical protein
MITLLSFHSNPVAPVRLGHFKMTLFKLLGKFYLEADQQLIMALLSFFINKPHFLLMFDQLKNIVIEHDCMS